MIRKPFWTRSTRLFKKVIKQKFESEFKELNKKYFEARNEYNMNKNGLNEIKNNILQLDARLHTLVIECVSLKIYISEVNRMIPVN